MSEKQEEYNEKIKAKKTNKKLYADWNKREISYFERKYVGFFGSIFFFFHLSVGFIFLFIWWSRSLILVLSYFFFYSLALKHTILESFSTRVKIDACVVLLSVESPVVGCCCRRRHRRRWAFANSTMINSIVMEVR